MASSHYSIAISQVSAQISGTPKPVHEKMLSSVESAYSDSLARATAGLQAALAHTTLLATPTQAPYESISSLASSRLAEGLSIASAQYSSAKSAAGLEQAPAHERYLNDAQRKYYEGIGLAHDRYSSFMSAATSAFSTPTANSFDSMISAAQSQYLSLIHI